MKKYLLLILMFVAAVSCDKRVYDVPETKTPVYETDSEIITIAELKAYAQSNNGMNPDVNPDYSFGYLQDSSGAKDEIHTDQVKIIPFPDKKAIKAIVVGDDESGNIYKQLYLQDATGGILLTVDLTGLFGKYSVGQEVIVEMQGLCIGRYYGAFQIGSPVISESASGNHNMSRMKPYDFYNNVHANGTPDINKANDLLDTLSVVPANTSQPDANNEHLYNTFVRLENVTFVDGGVLAFAPLDNNGNIQNAVNRNLNVVGGNNGRIPVRTSGYANFAGDTLPTGPCNITAILSQYFGQFQITLRTRKDIEQINN
ncbi:MAG: DUF5689 domain-containing protein [Bacteroidales bacterium]|jgi:hypothetical protein|nr:DUF5689 domain-containing protein [Bacteroidales bacterium]